MKNPHTTDHLLSVMMQLSDDESWFIDSVGTLAASAGMTQAQVRYRLKKLVETGLLVVRRRFYLDGGIKPNGYLIVPLVPATEDPDVVADEKLDQEFREELDLEGRQGFGIEPEPGIDRFRWFREILPSLHSGAKTPEFYRES